MCVCESFRALVLILWSSNVTAQAWTQHTLYWWASVNQGLAHLLILPLQERNKSLQCESDERGSEDSETVNRITGSVQFYDWMKWFVQFSSSSVRVMKPSPTSLWVVIALITASLSVSYRIVGEPITQVPDTGCTLIFITHWRLNTPTPHVVCVLQSSQYLRLISCYYTVVTQY